MSVRVVITGMGTVNPVGSSIPSFWRGIREGRSGIRRITRFDPSEYATRIAGEVQDFDAAGVLDRKEARKMDRYSQFAMTAVAEALGQAGLADGGYEPERAGVTLGSGLGGFETVEETYEKLIPGGPKRIAPTTIPKFILNIAAGNIAKRYDLEGPSVATVSACASGADAVGNAYHWIQRGAADVMVTCGTEAGITKIGVGGFNAVHALSTGFNESPAEASRPFDARRDGFVMGEGAGAIILESLDHARARNATVLGELLGYGVANDAYHLTAPHPDGRGAVRSMRMALADAGIHPSRIHYINAHGTSTKLNDAMETKAIKEVFGEHAHRLKVSSTKSMTGHLIGATGTIEAIVCVLTIRDGVFPSTRNLTDPDPDCDLDYVPELGTTGHIEYAMTNSFGFGGHNAVLVLGPAPA
jgi:3-oxoacyl-[acyl-carrier-protein] synthase II